jgi:hypothetical protein
MINKYENRLEYRSHNGRRYNIIITYEPDTEEFHLSTPGISKIWNKSDPIDDEIQAIFKTDEEIKQLNDFINIYL